MTDSKKKIRIEDLHNNENNQINQNNKTNQNNNIYEGSQDKYYSK